MNAEPSIVVTNLTKTYQVFRKRQLLLTQPFRLFNAGLRGISLSAIDSVSFQVNKGEIFGIIGHNGSGKSTLLKVLSGITKPDSGSCQMEGRVTSVLELGVGFEPELTGRENLYLYGSLIGLSSETITRKEQEIINFSGIRTYIDDPVKTYSSGMLIRLAFATAINTDPDILLLDEVLGVGDVDFQHRSFQAIQKAVSKGVTVVIVSHGLSFVGGFCDRVMCLENGHVTAMGHAEEVINAYMDSMSNRDKLCTISQGRTQLRLVPGGFHIDCDGQALTVSNGCSINLRRWEMVFSSTEASFTIMEQSTSMFVVQVKWGHWNLNQIWRVELLNDREILWEVLSESGIEENVDSVEKEFMVSSVYSSFALPEEIREFPEPSTRGFSMEYLLSQKHGRQFSGVTTSNSLFPSIIMDFSQSPSTGNSMVVSGGNLVPARIIQRGFSTVDSHSMLKTTIRLFEREELMAYYQSRNMLHGVSVNALKATVQNQVIHLFKNTDKISTGLGFHIRWPTENSTRNVEQELICSDNSLFVRRYHETLPVVTNIQLLPEKEVIRWVVTLDILDRIEFSFPQVIIEIGPENSDFLCIDPQPIRTATGIILTLATEKSTYSGHACRLDLSSGTLKLKD